VIDTGLSYNLAPKKDIKSIIGHLTEHFNIECKINDHAKVPDYNNFVGSASLT
jgi:hypothetical protein